MGSAYDLLSNEFRVLGLIYAFNEKGVPVYQKRMAEKLSDRASPNTITRSLNRLFDLGLINGQWKKIDGSRWARVYSVTGEGTSLAKSIYAHSKAEFDELL